VRLRSHLETAGYAMWQDERQIRAGHAWTDEIRAGLRNSDLVVALLSPHAVRRAGWSDNADDQDSVCVDEIEARYDQLKNSLPTAVSACLAAGQAPLRKWGQSSRRLGLHRLSRRAPPPVLRPQMAVRRGAGKGDRGGKPDRSAHRLTGIRQVCVHRQSDSRESAGTDSRLPLLSGNDSRDALARRIRA
jgi:hypothetical protein